MKEKYILIYGCTFCLITFLLDARYKFYCYIILLLSIKSFRLLLINMYYNLIYYIKYLFSKNEYRLYQKNDRAEKIIVSLTTYNKRIKTVFLAIESIFQQNIKPDKIVLWLDKDEFAINTIPNTLKKQIKQGLEVKFYHNIKSYKKLIPSLINYPNDIIITIDDDILYPKNCIENLYNSYLKNKMKVHCNYLFKFLNSDFQSTININKLSYLFNYVGTGGGVLFPPNIFQKKDIFNEEIFMKLAPIQDDLFISVLLIKENIGLKNVNDNYIKYTKLIKKRTILNTQSIGLFKQNCFKNQTKVQLFNLLDYYNIKLQEI